MCLDWRTERKDLGLMSPLTAQSDGWLICLQKVQMEWGGRDGTKCPNHLLSLSQVEVLGHLDAYGPNSQWISHHGTLNMYFVMQS